MTAESDTVFYLHSKSPARVRPKSRCRISRTNERTASSTTVESNADTSKKSMFRCSAAVHVKGELLA